MAGSNKSHGRATFVVPRGLVFSSSIVLPNPLYLAVLSFAPHRFTYLDDVSIWTSFLTDLQSGQDTDAPQTCMDSPC